MAAPSLIFVIASSPFFPLLIAHSSTVIPMVVSSVRGFFFTLHNLFLLKYMNVRQIYAADDISVERDLLIFNATISRCEIPQTVDFSVSSTNSDTMYTGRYNNNDR